MARPTHDRTLKVTFTIPGTIRTALANHVKTEQRTNPGTSQSAFITDLLRRTLNVSGTGLPPEQRAETEALWNDVREYVAKDEPMAPDATLTALNESGGVCSKNKELWQAVFWFVLSAARSPDRLRRAVESTRILIPRVDYSDFENEISNLIHGWAANHTFEQTRFEFADPAAGAFDAATNLEFPLTEKVLYLFPFFLTEFRRSWAGIVRYAKHEAVGLIVRKESSFLEQRELDVLKENGRKGDEGAKRLRLKFLSRLFSEFSKTTAEQPARLVVEDNYLRREMIPLLLTNCQHGIPVEKFSARQFWKIEERLNDKNKDEEVKKVITDFAERKNDVILFDLGWNKKIVKAVEGDTNYTVIHFAHEQDIPVGIGFSLPALAFMGRQIPGGNGKTVADAFMECVGKILASDSIHKSNLWDAGIVLDDIPQADSNES